MTEPRHRTLLLKMQLWNLVSGRGVRPDLDRVWGGTGSPVFGRVSAQVCIPVVQQLLEEEGRFEEGR